MKPYRIIYKRDYAFWKQYSDYENFGFFDTIKEAGEARKVSGDLVVHSNTLEIVKSQEWLFDWEKKDLDCYAQRAIKNGI